MGRTIRWARPLLAAAVLAAASGVALAAPASAGCEKQTYARFCDGPIGDDGKWNRCSVAYGAQTAFGQMIYPTTYSCYTVGPGEYPIHEPQYHIDP
ncbi:hypothetical protein MMAD_49880 [Mycolicibacterium madagascariense]|uniref:CDGP domain-containing protein n=1 Tax=Mycolicibacterium madagascariense TaxID=212765 RepID=A0A7I7XNP2_9MYCO|nr:hypothetical protein [Mycolicibacterium madagascariense]MCV7015644.1 hypothetical protein [Mycolicibacterium madagascariense]BBZ30693.1 hypothetical protein MMAD_49880 [Mycolicibacterium madagascariense]